MCRSVTVHLLIVVYIYSFVHHIVTASSYTSIKNQLLGIQECANCFNDQQADKPEWMDLLKKAIDTDSSGKFKQFNVYKILAVRTEDIAGTYNDVRFISHSPMPNSTCEARFYVGFVSGKISGLNIVCDNGSSTEDTDEESYLDFLCLILSSPIRRVLLEEATTF